MHEASLMRGLMRNLQSLAANEGVTHLKRVKVWLGALSHFSAEHFREHFEEASVGTCAEDATLEIEISTDIADPRAQEVLVESVDVEVPE